MRQIISCINHPTHKLCKYIDDLFKPFLNSIKHILRDSQQLLQEGLNFTHKNKLYLYSCDFESLYNNIKHDHAIELISNFLYFNTDILSKNKLDLIAIRTFLLLIFTSNIFNYKDKYYIQLKGIPMGCICGPSIANIYIYILEKEYLIKHTEIRMYKRFIDDIFIGSDILINLNEFESTFIYLKLNIEHKDSVNFLDLEISFDSIIGRLEFKLYIKPTNTFSYLLPSSNHPSHIFENIPLSLFKRIKRICSNFIDFLHFSRFLYVKLLERGYNSKKLDGIIREVSKIDRKDLIPYNKEKNVNTRFNENSNKKIFIEYDSSHSFIKNYLYKNYKSIIKEQHRIFNNNNLVVVNSVKKNLSSIFVNNFNIDKTKKFFYSKCNKEDCFICRLSLNYYYIYHQRLFLPLRSISNCESTGIIYIILCVKCKTFYIGQSQNTVKKRIGEHINSIRRFKKDLNKSIINLESFSETAVHFNETGHNVYDDFKFVVFETNVINKELRLSIETDLINLFNKLNIKILNSLIPSKNKISYLTFQDRY